MRLQVGDKVEFAKEYVRGFVLFDKGTKATIVQMHETSKGTDVVVFLEKEKVHFGWTSVEHFRKV